MAKTNYQIFNEENAPERTYNDSEYKEATQRVGGVMPGMALSRMHNKMYYQWSAMCKAIANLIVNRGRDCMDSDVAGITKSLEEVIQSGGTAEITTHRTAAELDHPDGSVTTKKLSDAAVTGAKIANKTIGKEHLKDGVVDDKAPIASPALTGTPTVPTASKGTNTDQIASTAFVAQAVAALNGLDSMDKLAKEIEGKLGKQGIVAGNLEANGWVKFADGLIVQWGIIKEVHFDSTDIPVTFPIAFTKSCFVVIPTLHQPIATGGSITAFVKRGTITLQGCTCVADHSNERPTGDMFFLAIGI